MRKMRYRKSFLLYYSKKILGALFIKLKYKRYIAPKERLNYFQFTKQHEKLGYNNESNL